MYETDIDRARIRNVVDDWAVLRDGGDWDAFAEVWSENGWMTATWFRGSAAAFIAASRAGAEAGVQIAHTLGGHSSRLAGDRAVARTTMTIHQRGRLHGVTVDVTCHGRFVDFLLRERGAWRIRRRQPLYDRDRLDVVDPGASLVLDDGDRRRLERFPRGYRHLALLQEHLGERVDPDLPGLTGPRADLLHRQGAAWLEGADDPFLAEDPAAGRSPGRRSREN